MLPYLDTSSLLFTVATVGVLSLVLGMVMNAILQSDGFGAVGNALILGAGFMLGIYAANWHGIRLTNLPAAAGIGLAGAFASVALLAILKARFSRR